MTSITDIIADIRNRLARLNVPDEPWVLQDGCSWRRIGTQHHRGPDGNVLRPYIAPDGHPDIAAAHGVLDYIIAVQPSNIAAVLDALEKAEREQDASKEEARMAWSSDEHQAVWAELKARAEAAEKERDEANRRWSEVCADFISLQKAIVGDSGLSAILRVDALKAAETKLNDLEEWVTEAQIAMREIADTDPVDNMLDPQRPARIARKWLGEEKS